jgi:excisionase family DNA binding protein
VEKLYPLKEISEVTRTSVPYWRKAIARKELRAVRIGRAVRVAESELSRFLAGRQPPSARP